MNLSHIAPQPNAPFPPLAVLDWGIGGFGFVSALRRRFGSISYTYLSDSGYTPYGKVPSMQLAQRLSDVGAYLYANGVQQLVIACYSASTVAARAKWPPDLHVVNVLNVALSQSRTLNAPSFGIVGGQRTIRSQALARPLRALGATVMQRVAQPLSAHIERGDLNSPALLRDLDRIVAPLHGVHTLILACTHYPAIASLFSERLPHTNIFDPIDALVDVVETSGLQHNTRQRSLVLTTGDPIATERSAAAAFGVRVHATALRDELIHSTEKM